MLLLVRMVLLVVVRVVVVGCRDWSCGWELLGFAHNRIQVKRLETVFKQQWGSRVGGWKILGFIWRPGGKCFGERKEVESMQGLR